MAAWQEYERKRMRVRKVSRVVMYHVLFAARDKGRKASDTQGTRTRLTLPRKVL